MAAVVDPVGRKANWSLKSRCGFGICMAGYINSRTTIFSITLERTGVINIGRKSEQVDGVFTFGIGLINACFHWLGTIDLFNDLLNRVHIGRANTGAPSRRNQAGSLSSL